MPAFPDTIPESHDFDGSLPTARIGGESLILPPLGGRTEEWPLAHVHITELEGGGSQATSGDGKRSWTSDGPQPFGQAVSTQFTLWAAHGRSRPKGEPGARTRRGARVVGDSGRSQPPSGRRSRGRRLRRSRRGVSTLGLIIMVAVLAPAGYLVGSRVGNLVDSATTGGSNTAQAPPVELVVRTFHGVGDEVTGRFSIDEPWEIQWELERAQGARLNVVVLTEGEDQIATVAVQEEPGSGTSPQFTPGIYSLEITSTGGGEWTIRVVGTANL